MLDAAGMGVGNCVDTGGVEGGAWEGTFCAWST